MTVSASGIAFGGGGGKLAAQRDIWCRKPLLREIYAEFYRAIEARLSDAEGPTVEVGGGPGRFKEFRRGTISFDVAPCPWLDFAADACRPPLAPGSVANVVMIDVLHHLAYVQRFFDAISEALQPGGRIVMIEPYISPASWWVYQFIHPEHCSLSIQPLDVGRDEPVNDPGGAWDSNQALPTVLFWRDLEKFEKRFPRLRVVGRRRMSLLLYPLSGGFGHPSLVPSWAVGVVRSLESNLMFLARLAAFRCLVVIERR